MPANEKIYIATTLYLYQYYVCGWPEAVLDCFVLQTSLLNEAFNLIANSSILNKVNESVESEACSPCKSP